LHAGRERGPAPATDSPHVPYTIGIDARKLGDFGIGTYVRNLVAGLAAIDRENRYVLFVGREAPDDLPENFRVIEERAPVYSIRELVALSWRLHRLKLDLYHATHYVLPAIVPCRAVVTIHDIIHLLYPQFLPNRLAFLYAQRMIRRSLQRGERIIAVSQNTKSDLIDYFGVGGRKIRVIYNGVEEEFRRRLPADEVRRRVATLGIQPPYLLFVGNPKPHKNLENVVRAYALAQALYDFDQPLVCVGDRQGDFKIRQIAEQLGVGGKVRLVGHVEQAMLPAIYQGATLFLYPTLYEGFGQPVIEAMASGVPVITSNGSALREIATSYAELVEPLDVNAMAHAIAGLLSDPERRRELSERGTRRAADFRWLRTAERTRDVYFAAIRSRTPTTTTQIDLRRHSDSELPAPGAAEPG
jgi:glycosyltransferase involved in cell wall biosynthesis